ncbi:MAG: sulfurtransferase-like selenium metabolism protein YedF [Tissierellia bacterium]|jgi:selenium metabolism protein YedF|nr:sulfurtransferase-like selenium metabolism protein YedF [Tissierellia bacterium]MDD3225929.1 sulfurtransferase-like selenium metabolism protein YedF [Tissierellia bacterium]MDD3750873.1 sulfurtransferase-like selenium metabolism protein YedF [Tissierellia bacterium]MDD4045856.1 sulfurtransferase-like selenium metabolism protein YedF [Tissierellia bacterium]MDD4678026.1 sulfurtransferase-like selenium metabolism protein YedF [Tissierellia bacterium]
MKIVDARKKACPQPVIMTKKEADEGAEEITVIVDNETAKLNVTKLASQLRYSVTAENKEDGIYILLIKGAESKEQSEIVSKTQNKNIGYLITSDKLGKGSDDLGRILMKSFLFTLSETKPYPDFLIFLNSGVKLTTEGSESIEDLIKLKEGRVEIVSCGTCLDFFEIKSKLQVGSVSNMYDIVDMISNSTNTVTI